VPRHRRERKKGKEILNGGALKERLVSEALPSEVPDKDRPFNGVRSKTTPKTPDEGDSYGVQMGRWL